MIVPHTSKIILIGATSVIGSSVLRIFPNQVIPVINRHNKHARNQKAFYVNLEDNEALRSFLDTQSPDVLIYAHAVCHVAKCENNPEWAWHINVHCLKKLLSFLPFKTRMVYISSDHVFGHDGVYQEKDKPCPISTYGRTRVKAEKYVLERSGALVIRTSLAIGPSLDKRKGHWDWLRYRSQKKLPVTIVKDEYRSAVWADDLAKRIMDLAKSSVCGIRHIPAASLVSRPELARFLIKKMKLPLNFNLTTRAQKNAPLLGRIELQTLYKDEFAQPLPAIIK